MKAKVALVKCNSYERDLVSTAVGKAIGLLGGITNFIKPQSRVLVKPNLLMAKEPASGIDTHPEVVRAVVKILKEIKCEVLLGDGPSVWGNQIEDVDAVYEKSGITQVAQDEGAQLVKFDQRRWRGKFPLTTWLDNCDYLVNLPKFKTHDFTLLTGAVKNLFGLVCGTYKTELHKKYFQVDEFSKILLDIYAQAPAQLTIIDGIMAMEGDGPATGGKLRRLNLLLAGADCVALDSVMAVIMGINPFDVSTIKEGVRRKLGTADISSVSILGEELKDVIGEPFLLPATSFKKKLPAPIVKMAGKLIRYYPVWEPSLCTKCGACIQACPAQAVAMRKTAVHFDYGRCIACFCCSEVCPNNAIKIKKSLFAKLIGL